MLIPYVPPIDADIFDKSFNIPDLLVASVLSLFNKVLHFNSIFSSYTIFFIISFYTCVYFIFFSFINTLVLNI